MTRRDFDEVFGHTPQPFIDRVNETLDRLEGEDDMKKRYKFSTMLLVAALVMSLVGGSVAIGTGLVSDNVTMSEPGVLPFVEETVQLEIATPHHYLVLSYDDNYMTKLVESETGLDIVWQLLPGTETDTVIDLMLASGDELPDVFLYPFGSKSAAYGAEGYFIPLNDYFDKETGLAYNFWNTAYGMTESDYTDYFTGITEADGNIYGYGFFAGVVGDRGRVLAFINREWLKALNMEMPTTKDELYDTLVAFRDNDPNGNGQKDEIPMIGKGWNGGDDEYLINLFTYWNPDYALNVENDKVYAPFVTEEWQEAMIFMNKLVKEGLLSDMTFSITQDEMVSLLQSYGPKDQIIGLWCGTCTTNIPDGTSEAILAYDVQPPLEGQYTPQRIHNVTKNGFITSDCQIPELAFRFFDYWAEEKHALISRYGEPGVDWMYYKDDPEAFDAYFVGGAAQRTEALGLEVVFGRTDTQHHWVAENNVIWNSHVTALLPVKTYGANATNSTARVNSWEEASAEDLNGYRNYMNSAAMCWQGVTPEQLFIAPVYTQEEFDQYNDTITQVKSYVNECIASFALGTLDPVADWDTYVANLESAGLNDWLEVAQAYWTRSH